jgi:hypothetical protein
VARVQDTDKYVDQYVGCNSGGASVNDDTQTVITFAVPRWVCFSVAFCTVFQAFLTTFLIDSGYKTPIQNMDEMFAPGIKLAYSPDCNFIFANGGDKEVSKLQRNLLKYPMNAYRVCLELTMYHKCASIFISDFFAEIFYAICEFVGENSEPFRFRLEDEVIFSVLTMIMFHGNPLNRIVSEIIDRLHE